MAARFPIGLPGDHVDLPLERIADVRYGTYIGAGAARLRRRSLAR